MKTLLLLLVLASTSAMAVDGMVTYVSRKLRMSESEPVPAKEIYVNLGLKHGVKAGEVLEVSRLQPVWDGADGKALRIPLGELVVETVGETMSLTRVSKMREPAELPRMESSQLMVGDEVQRKSNLPFQ